MLAERMMARLSADRDAGLLPTDFEPRIVVPIVITYLQGLWRMALVSYDRGEYERQIDTFLTGLRL
jgi:TetR/AcrR family transcriptional repressor of nem operon